MKNLFVISIFLLMSVSGFNQNVWTNWSAIMTENFDNPNKPFPTQWDSAYSSPFDAYWGSNSYNAYGGSGKSGWCIQTGLDRNDPWYPVGTANSNVIGHFPISGSMDLRLKISYDFEIRYLSDTADNFLKVYISNNNVNWDSISLPQTYCNGQINWTNPHWKDTILSLSNYCNNGNNNLIYIRITYINLYGYPNPGAAIDNIILENRQVGVGIEENKTSNVNVYPNPSNGNFTIDNLTPGKPLDIYDMTGKVVYHTISFNTMNINLNVSPGVYMIKSENISKKIIVN